MTTKYDDGYTKDELKEGLKKLKELAEKDSDGELSDADLEAVAGEFNLDIILKLKHANRIVSQLLS